ncbi:Dyp-type peroxidase [Streptomyces acidiscabies]|uniref:Dyp-type peroxidase n=1 Tax=Streptomyces acidiscabies TaxID=42234 RepID=A0AAP6EDV8_9ACTN|nr:Dyp-type peroxidase [Streptomyces acidiscabies]MBP5941660.1 Dyp-type peroxidase [Streptomyces sp. LBUM 1476]MBZ3913064.1 Dyp-type peroxidase [Streptomyces acidiscabies]MDX2958551.1 Dyp-type peroxidase [Streptomyces acidiscabies]MDX3020943.1 Dyp-type peroxidase [Streptomyces acidiscabies]MDX3790028.1 Dyp-type peroxidase [Streptomyces acidiscabies]
MSSSWSASEHRPDEERAQPVVRAPASAAVFLVFTVEPGGEPVARDLLAGLAGLVRSIGFGHPEGQLSCVAGVGAEGWDRICGAGERPAALHPFRPLEGPRHRAVATPGDLLFHLRATRPDLCFALATEIVKRLRGVAVLQDEVHAFSYFDARNLLGFVDGTENPVGRIAAETALVGAEDPAFAGGSYAIVQKYLHDVEAWEKLATEEQEGVIGRTKATNIELERPGSHVDVNTLTGDDGEERRILRAALPFGRPGHGEFGTYFIAYAGDPEIPETMLRRMFLGTQDTGPDPILDFSEAVTGTLFFVPPTDFLKRLAAR